MVNFHNLKKKILGIFGKKKKVTLQISQEELQKSFLEGKKFTEALHDIFLAFEMQFLDDLYQELRKNIDKNIRKVGVNFAKNKIHQ